MDGAEEEIQTLPIEDPSSSTENRRKLKRLKKASDDADLSPESPTNENIASEFGEIPYPNGFSDPGASFESPSEGKDFEDGLDPLFGVESVELGTEKNVEEAEECWNKGSAKRRLDLNEGEEKPNMKTEVSGKLENTEGKSKESARERKKLEKTLKPSLKDYRFTQERKVYLAQLHVESQKLLRETRDASFELVKVADKPISSVLEKIRMRKHELLKRNSTTKDGGHNLQAQCTTSNTNIQAKSLSVQDANKDGPDEISRSEENMPGSSLHEPASDTNYQSIDPDLNINSDSSDESSSSSDEENDKENISPIPERLSSVNLYRNNDLVKGFVDEEAEEEDDSDHDMMRFHDHDDDDEDDDDEAEILTDLIAPGFKEKSSDTDKRNELHQKWLQYQDASDTDNLLQRLNSHPVYKKTPLMIHNEDDAVVDDDENDDEDDDGDDESEADDEDLNPTHMNSARENVLKAKKSISLMFTDSADAYVSDDEEIEANVLRSSLSLDHSLDKTSALAPADDDNSREIFDLIRKTNSLPEKPTRKPSALTGNFGSLALKGNGVSFKPSFLGRATVNGVSSSARHVSSGSRSFVFARDDSNSRSSDLAENISDAPQRHPAKTKAPEKSTLRRVSEDSSSGGSLFKILRRTCDRVDQKSLTSMASVGDRISNSQTVRQFSAFRLSKKTS